MPNFEETALAQAADGKRPMTIDDLRRSGELLGRMPRAADYEATLRSIHADRPPDLILLGMGEDAHTASARDATCPARR